MIQNADFELGTCRDTFNGTQWGEIEVPQNWIAWWSESDGFYRPEMKVIQAVAPYLNPARVNTGQKALMFFGFYKKIYAGLYQQITVPTNSKITFTAFAHSWYSMRDDATKSEWIDDDGVIHQIQNGDDGFNLSVGIDTTGNTDPFSPDIIWKTEHYYNQYGQIKLELEVSGTITLYLKGEPDYPFKHCDCYFDTADVTIQPIETDCVCPRVEYERTYHLLPQNATLADAQKASAIAYQTRGTVGYSADDAGIGPQNRNVVSYWTQPNSWNGNELSEFFNQFYPGVNLSRVNLYDETPIIPPPSTNHRKPYTKNMIGLHSGYPKNKWDEYLTQAKPALVKTFSCGFAEDARKKALEALVIWRKHSDDYVDCVAPIEQNATKLLDYYSAEIRSAAQNTGRTESQLIDSLQGVVIESLNEKIPTHNYNQTSRAVSFDVAFANQLKARYGGKLVPGVLTVAIGNPYHTEDEISWLLPAVEAAINAGGYVAYHGYWSANEQRSFLEEKWQWHAGRWTEWDKVFTAHNLYPSYYLGECGVVYASDGENFNSGKGWKSCGGIERYLTDMDTFNRLVNQWNHVNNYRCFGGTIFGYGNWGWDNFEIGEGDLMLMKQRAISNWLL